MRVVLQYSAGCPNWLPARDLVQTALHHVGLPADALVLQRVETEDDAQAVRFRGSPTLLLDGVDPFGDQTSPVGLSCRVFRTPAGLAGTPTLEQLVRALEQRT